MQVQYRTENGQRTLLCVCASISLGLGRKERKERHAILAEGSPAAQNILCMHRQSSTRQTATIWLLYQALNPSRTVLFV